MMEFIFESLREKEVIFCKRQSIYLGPKWFTVRWYPRQCEVEIVVSLGSHSSLGCWWTIQSRHFLSVPVSLAHPTLHWNHNCHHDFQRTLQFSLAFLNFVGDRKLVPHLQVAYWRCFEQIRWLINWFYFNEQRTKQQYVWSHKDKKCRNQNVTMSATRTF